MSRTVVKGQLKHLLSAQKYLRRVQLAVATVNTIVRNAYTFFRLVVLQRFENEVAGDVRNFDRTIARRLSATVKLDKDGFENALDVVSSKLIDRVGRPYGAEKLLRMTDLHAAYINHATRGALPHDKPSGTNLSYALAYEAESMQTAFHNNIFLHFDKYVKRFMHASLAPQALARHGVDAVRRLPTVPFRDLGLGP